MITPSHDAMADPHAAVVLHDRTFEQHGRPRDGEREPHPGLARRPSRRRPRRRRAWRARAARTRCRRSRRRAARRRSPTSAPMRPPRNAAATVLAARWRRVSVGEGGAMTLMASSKVPRASKAWPALRGCARTPRRAGASRPAPSSGRGARPCARGRPRSRPSRTRRSPPFSVCAARATAPASPSAIAWAIVSMCVSAWLTNTSRMRSSRSSPPTASRSVASVAPADHLARVPLSARPPSWSARTAWRGSRPSRPPGSARARRRTRAR